MLVYSVSIIRKLLHRYKLFSLFTTLILYEKAVYTMHF